MDQLEYIDSTENYRIPVRISDIEQATVSMLILPALGVRSRFYDNFAEGLNQAGFRTVQMEWRGNGESSLRPSRKVDFGYRDLLEDVTTVSTQIKQRFTGQPLYLAGHSLGGHLAILSSAVRPELASGIALIASCSPSYRYFNGRFKTQLKIASVLTPLLTGLLGYFPGDKVGFAGKEAKTLMRDWCHLLKTDQFRVRGYPEINQTVSQSTHKVLSIAFDRDIMAPADAVAGLTQRLNHADITSLSLTAEELGAKADHYAWARQPEVVVDQISQWVAN